MAGDSDTTAPRSVETRVTCNACGASGSGDWGHDCPGDMPRCATCRHWKLGEPAYFGYDDGMGVCDVNTEQIATFDDLVTGPDFGCIHHEEKP